MRRRAAAFALLLALPGTAAAEVRLGVRVGSHADHGRVVVDARSRLDYQVEQEAGRVTVRFAAPGGLDLPAMRRPPRNVTALEAVEGGLAIAVPPGVRVRHFRLDSRIVVDLLDPAPARAAARPPQVAATPAPHAVAPAPAPPAAMPVRSDPPPAPPPAPRGPVIEVSGGALVIPAPAGTGAALLRRGSRWLVVLDAPIAPDLAALRADPRLASAELAPGPRGTVLSLPAEALPDPQLARSGTAWRLERDAGGRPLRSILPATEPGPPPRLMLRAGDPGESVPVLDPETGAILLVGTLLDGGEGVPVARRGASFELLPTRLGVALLPRADTLTLRALADRFVADAGEAGLALGPALAAGAADAEAMSRHLDLPGDDVAGLWARERNAMLAVAAAPPLGRAAPRLRAAEALLALGLGQEAQSMAALAMREDPRAAADPRARALQAAAALVGGRIAEAAALAAPDAPTTDEAVLWRGLLQASRGEAAAPAIAAGLPILLSYPEPLRARLLPLAAEALAEGGEAAAARRLLAGREAADPALALARARLSEAEGRAEEALAAYDEIARGRDRRSRALAMRRAAELRLATGRLDTAGAAAAVEATIAAWRGDAREAEARRRAAELRMEAGDPRGAFDLLRETELLFPDLAAELRPRRAAALAAALEREEPVAAVALLDSHAALLPAGAPTERALTVLAERLTALDLTDRAREVLRGAAARAEPGPERARIGARLAALALAGGDAAAARAALSGSDSPGLEEALRQERALLMARALSRLGAPAEAEASYRAAGPGAGVELAEFLAARQEWRGAAAALAEHLRAVLPDAPAALDAGQQRLVARHAALLALAGEQGKLAQLGAAEAPRMSGGAMREAFALLTATPLSGPADLPRLRVELELARALPGRLESLRDPAGGAR